MPEGQLHLELCSAEHPPVSLEAAEVTIPGARGVFTVLPGHTPLLTALVQGVVVADPGDGGERQFFAVHCGFCEVAGDRITILADVMETQAAIDEARAQDALRRAEEALKKRDSEADVLAAEAALARANARLRANAGEA